MDGGPGEQPIPQRNAAGIGDENAQRIVEVAVAAQAARAAADADTLTADTFLNEALARIGDGISDLTEARWATRGPATVAAAVRAIARQQARLDAAYLTLVHAIDTRDDVVPRSRATTTTKTTKTTRNTGAAFLRAGLGLDPGKAKRDATLARLTTSAHGQTPDLAAVGAAYAAGQISRAHVEVAARVHDRLGPTIRDTPTGPADTPDDAGDAPGQPGQRCIEVVDAALAGYARAFTVPEFTRIADRLIQNLNPPQPGDAHHRRYLYLSQLADGTLYGRFACGGAQALTLTTALAALSAPRPGLAITPDGDRIDLPDERTTAQRRMDALVDAIHHGARTRDARTAGDAPDAAAGEAAEPPRPDRDDSGVGGSAGNSSDPDSEDNDVARHGSHSELIKEVERESFNGDLAQNCGEDLAQDPGDLAQSPEPPEPPEQQSEPRPEGDYEIRRAPGVRAGPYPDVEIIVTATLDQLAHARDHATAPPRQAALDGVNPPNGRGGGGFAYAQHGGPLHPATLALLACNARIRRVLLDEHGAVLHLGRAHRLATPAQKAALYARDIGCVIPGCTTPGDLCEIHHVTAWADGGATDIDNLAFLCPRHHIEVTDETWDLVMIDGMPWASPPAWAHPTRPLLRNATHHPPLPA